MPAAAPWLDQASPPQYSTFFAPRPVDPATSGTDSGPLGGWGLTMGAAANNSSVDTTLHWKVSGTILLALVVIFGLQAMGFRFVTSATVGFGR